MSAGSLREKRHAGCKPRFQRDAHRQEHTIMHSFRLGRIFGIDIRVDYSWVFIFVLMTWNMCSVFAQWHPQWPSVEQGLMGIAASLLFFGCVLVHELAHSAMAMRFGLSVRSITLFLF